MHHFSGSFLQQKWSLDLVIYFELRKIDFEASFCHSRYCSHSNLSQRLVPVTCSCIRCSSFQTFDRELKDSSLKYSRDCCCSAILVCCSSVCSSQVSLSRSCQTVHSNLMLVFGNFLTSLLFVTFRVAGQCLKLDL